MNSTIKELWLGLWEESFHMYKITVGISCYKQKHWLYRCLRSLARQTHSKSEFEVIVVNDEPGVDLSEVCDTMKDVLNIKLINNQENLGLPASLNKILNVSRGQYFVRVDADDYVSKHFLYMMATFLDLNKNYQAVACDYKKVNEVCLNLGLFSSMKYPIACGTMFTYESLCNVNFYNEEFKMREGHELLIRYKEKYKIYNLEVPLYRYRMHKNNRSSNISVTKKYDNKLNKNI
jgi:glycosyltransferase involved in cell wall biosynthesis